MFQTSNIELSYYLSQTKNTQLEDYEYMLDKISDNVESLFATCRNVLEHYNGINALVIDKNRYWEIEIDKVSDILSLLSQRGLTKLTEPTNINIKIISSCFNICKLAVALLRYKGIPARLRYAYCTYFNYKNNSSVNSEQVIVEYWDFQSNQWLRGDPSMNFEILKHLGIDLKINLLNVDRDLSQPIADVWINCRKGLWSFENYGVSLGKNRHRVGIGHVALKLTHDFACLNQIELSTFDFISSSKRFQKETNLYPEDFDKLAEILKSKKFEKFRLTNNEIPKSVLPKRVLRKSPLTGNRCFTRNLLDELL